MESANIFGTHFYSILIIVSMNLFDQLVIVTCDPIMKGLTPSRKGLVFGYNFVVFKMNFVD